MEFFDEALLIFAVIMLVFIFIGYKMYESCFVDGKGFFCKIISWVV